MTNLVPQDVIANKILLIRGRKVLLDKDLAELYGVKPIRLREQVKRNIKRFPEDFMFKLTKEETDLLVSQFAIPSKKHLGGYLPYVFTEQGVAMLSSVLNSERAIMVNIQIMRAFTKLREMLNGHADLRKKIENMERKMAKKFKNHDEQFKIIFDAIKLLLEPPKKSDKKIGFGR